MEEKWPGINFLCIHEKSQWGIVAIGQAASKR